jgi:hypothetical protein
MNTLVFEHDNQTLDVDIAYGYEDSNKYGKNSTFTEICMRADANLQSSSSGAGESLIRSAMPDLGESIFKGFKSRSKKIGLWFALKHVIENDYEAIPQQHEKDLIRSMKNYIEFIEGKA